jgi:uncharacterized membrane protein
MLAKYARALIVVEKLQIKNVGLFLIWVVTLTRHLKFLCRNKNYLFILFVVEFLYLFIHVVRRRQSDLSDFDRDNSKRGQI